MKKRNYLKIWWNDAVSLFPVLLAVLCFGPNPLNAQTKQAASSTPQLYNHAGEPVIRCHTMEADADMRALHPEMGTYDELMNWLNNATKKFEQEVQSGNKSMAVTTIPIIFHIIHDGEPIGTGSNLAAYLVDAQIAQLNNDFRKIAGTSGDNSNPVGADAEVEFCAAMQDPGGSPLAEPGIHRINRNTEGWATPPYGKPFIQGTIKPTTQWDPDQYLNIWVCGLTGGLLGYAQFPDASGLPPFDPMGGDANTDGVVIGTTTIGSTTTPNPNGAPYNKGRTATHEIGHWLGLTHIWGDGDCTEDDFVTDTPTAGSSNFGCPTGTDSCPLEPGIDMVENYMDYTDDDCMNIVTMGQKTRLQTVLANSPRRGILGSSTACMPPLNNDDCINAEPIACGQTMFGNTSYATVDNEIFCGTSGGTGGGVWYTWTGDGGLVELTTCGAGTDYDTKLRVYSGSCGALTCVGGDDDEFGTCSFSGLQSRVTFFSTPGTQYFILVHGFSSSVGNFELSMTCIPDPGNDDVCDALPMTLGVPISANGFFGTAQPGEVSPGAGTGGSSCNSQDGWCSFETGVQNSLWYTFVAPASGLVDISTDNSDDAQLALWSVGDCNDFGTFTEIAANDDGGPGLAPLIDDACVVPGETYYVQIDDFGGPPSVYNTNLTVTEVGNSVVINCPADITITCADPIDPIFTGEATANTDYCCPVAPVITSSDVIDPNASTITRTWTADFDCGTAVPCDQIITIQPSVFLISCTPTDETCAGAGDGTITIVATGDGGQIQYSIDGGISWQLTGNFANLTPGSYEIAIRLLGFPLNCAVTDTKTINAGPAPTVWYKDNDGDGYTDGVTQTSCTQPSGYKAWADLTGPEEDCDDNKATWFPGQTWYPDYDVDFYGALPAVVQCSRPAGHRRADNLIEVDTDCDNNNAAINPGATEICNGIDDNCDGQIDENLSGETYVGNVSFTTQAQLDAWMACYEVIQGNVTIQGSNITDLTPLANIVEITGNLMIVTNSTLTTLNGLENLSTVGGSLMMYYNFQLSDCCAIDDLLTNSGVGGSVIIFFNATGSHCNSAADIMAACPVTPLVENPGQTMDSGLYVTPEREAGLSLFPNPAGDQVTMLFQRTAPTATLRIMDMLGRVVFAAELEEGMDRLNIDLNNGQFGNGLYLVSLYENGEMTTKQLVVQQ